MASFQLRQNLLITTFIIVIIGFVWLLMLLSYSSSLLGNQQQVPLVQSKTTFVGIPDYLNFINDPNNKSPITQVQPINSKILYPSDDNLKEFVKQYVGRQRETIDFPSIDEEQIFPVHTDVRSVSYAEITDQMSIEWEGYTTMSTAYVFRDNQKYVDIYIQDWLTKNEKVVQVAQTRLPVPSPNTPFYPSIFTSIKNGTKIRSCTKYLTTSNTVHTYCGNKVKLPKVNRLLAEYTYNDTTIATEEACLYIRGNWINGECHKTEIMKAEMSEIVDFYRNNPIKPTPEVKNVIAEYLNTEILAIPPIPLRIENKDFNSEVAYIEKIDNFVLQEFDAKAQLSYFVKAKSYFNFKNSPALLIEPEVTLYDEKGLKDYVLNSKRAHYANNGEIKFKGEVVIQSSNGLKHKINTEELLVGVKTHDLISKKPVTYLGENVKITSQGIHMHAKDDTIKLTGGVIGRYE